MDCGRAQALMERLAHLTPDERFGLDEHAARCEACRHALLEEGELVRALGLMAHLRPSRRLQAALLAVPQRRDRRRAGLVAWAAVPLGVLVCVISTMLVLRAQRGRQAVVELRARSPIAHATLRVPVQRAEPVAAMPTTAPLHLGSTAVVSGRAARPQTAAAVTDAGTWSAWFTPVAIGGAGEPEATATWPPPLSRSAPSPTPAPGISPRLSPPAPTQPPATPTAVQGDAVPTTVPASATPELVRAAPSPTPSEPATSAPIVAPATSTGPPQPSASPTTGMADAPTVTPTPTRTATRTSTP